MSNFELRESVILMHRGQKLFATLHRPLRNERAVPVVLIIHGYAGTKVGRHRIYVQLSEGLSRVGIGSLRVDFRGCGDSEGSFEDTSLEDQIGDALISLDFLIKSPYFLTDRIGLLGRSLGGAVAVVAARRFGLVRSMALWCPVYSALPWQQEWEEAQMLHAKQNNQGKPLVQFQGHMASPTLFQELFKLQVDQELTQIAHLPLLHVHSESDEVVTIEHAEHYSRIRKGASGHTHFIRLKESDHEFSLLKERQHTIEETVAWFQKTLI